MRPDALASMQDICQILGIDAEPFGGFFDRQPLANDEADGCPVQSSFGTRVGLVLHVARRVRPIDPRDTQGSMLRAIKAQINRHLY